MRKERIEAKESQSSEVDVVEPNGGRVIIGTGRKKQTRRNRERVSIAVKSHSSVWDVRSDDLQQ